MTLLDSYSLFLRLHLGQSLQNSGSSAVFRPFSPLVPSQSIRTGGLIGCSTSISSVSVCHPPGSACQVSIMGPSSLDSTWGCPLGPKLAFPAHYSPLAPPAVFSALVSASFISLLASPLPWLVPSAIVVLQSPHPPHSVGLVMAQEQRDCIYVQYITQYIS